jgi:HAD superfamily hydrolase (TIGR01509 family)
MALRAIVFDFDGVIANSEPLHFQGYADVLAASGVTLTAREYYDRYLGYDDVGAFRAIAADRGLRWGPDRIATLVVEKAERLEQLERETSVLFPGAADAVRRAAEAVPVAIASGALKPEIVRILDRAGLTPLFRAIVSAEDTPASKPAPDPYLRALALLSAALGGPISAAECVAIEDSQWGLQSARTAGFRTVAVAQTYDAALLADADLVLRDVSALDVAELEALVVRG